MVINWSTVGVIGTLLGLVIGGTFALARLIFTSKSDTALPAQNIQQQIADAVEAAMATAQLENRVTDLERDLRATRDELHNTREELRTSRSREVILKQKVDEQQQQIDVLRRQLGERGRT